MSNYQRNLLGNITNRESHENLYFKKSSLNKILRCHPQILYFLRFSPLSIGVEQLMNTPVIKCILIQKVYQQTFGSSSKSTSLGGVLGTRGESWCLRLREDCRSRVGGGLLRGSEDVISPGGDLKLTVLACRGVPEKSFGNLGTDGQSSSVLSSTCQIDSRFRFIILNKSILYVEYQIIDHKKIVHCRI